jgi:hypothetical protein
LVGCLPHQGNRGALRFLVRGVEFRRFFCYILSFSRRPEIK